MDTLCYIYVLDYYTSMRVNKLKLEHSNMDEAHVHNGQKTDTRLGMILFI